MPHIVIIASGEAYQEAAAWAAPTYSRFKRAGETVSVLLPAAEPSVPLMRKHARQFGFLIRRFPLKLVSGEKFTSQLKCQGLYYVVSRMNAGEITLFVDADTCCLRRLMFPSGVRTAIRAGYIALVADIMDHHFRDATVPWYLAPEDRAPYVNSGVIAAAKASQPLFQKFRELSEQPLFLDGPFNDQKVINYALGRYFKDRLVLLDAAYNRIIPETGPGAITYIAHGAGGAGFLGEMIERKTAHAEKCAAQLCESGLLPGRETHTPPIRSPGEGDRPSSLQKHPA